MLDWTGQKLGNYQIVRPLGHGGFADVYLGQQIYLKTYAAIKVLQARMAHQDLQLFLHEARTIASLAHPSIVRVLEFGEEGHTPYLIMDYCPNGTLRQRHPKGTRVSLAECVVYLEQLADALHYAHDCRIVHRDVKPENILISSQNTVLLSDFGIATISQSSRYQFHQDIGGTIAYSAPEQLQGRANTASDQYSLGVVLYEWLAGELPYQGSFSEIASQHLVAPLPTIRSRVSSLPQAVEHVLQKALAKDPRQRFASVRDFAAALKMATEGAFALPLIQADQAASQANIATYLQTQLASPGWPLTPSIDPTVRQTAPFSTSWSHPLPYQQLQTPPHKRKTSLSIAIIVILLITLAGVSARTFLGTPAGNAQNGNALLSHGQANTQSPSAPAPPPTAAPPPKILQQKDRNLSCTTQFGTSCGTSITVHQFAIDPTTNQLLMKFTLKNLGTNSSSNSFFMNISFQDQTNAQYTATGQASDNSTWSIVAGQSLELTSLFPFVPQTGTPYTLKISASDVGGSFLDLSTSQFTF